MQKKNLFITFPTSNVLNNFVTFVFKIQRNGCINEKFVQFPHLALYMYVCVYMLKYVYAYIYIFLCVNVYIYLCVVCMCMHMHVCMCMHKCICVYVCVSMYVHVHGLCMYIFREQFAFQKKYIMFFIFIQLTPVFIRRYSKICFIIKLLTLSNKGMHRPFAFPSKCVEPL